MRIIPAIDILEGKCVRLSQGDFGRKTFYGNPLDVAKSFEDAGLTCLHLVDLDGAKAKHFVNHAILEKIALGTRLNIDVGGGMRTRADLKAAFNSGARQITAGSVALENPGMFRSWLRCYGAGRIILGADCHDRRVAGDAWLSSSDQDVVGFIKGYERDPISYVVCTDISKDGMLQGPAFALYKEILSSTSIQLIASGGISCLQDLVALKAMGCEGAIVGKALYEGKIKLNELKEVC